MKGFIAGGFSDITISRKETSMEPSQYYGGLLGLKKRGFACQYGHVLRKLENGRYTFQIFNLKFPQKRVRTGFLQRHFARFHQ